MRFNLSNNSVEKGATLHHPFVTPRKFQAPNKAPYRVHWCPSLASLPPGLQRWMSWPVERWAWLARRLRGMRPGSFSLVRGAAWLCQWVARKPQRRSCSWSLLELRRGSVSSARIAMQIFSSPLEGLYRFEQSSVFFFSSFLFAPFQQQQQHSPLVPRLFRFFD